MYEIQTTSEKRLLSQLNSTSTGFEDVVSHKSLGDRRQSAVKATSKAVAKLISLTR